MIATRLRHAAALLFFVILLAGISPATAATVEQIAGLTGPDRQKVLEEGAKKEGEVVWVGTFSEDNTREVLAGFAKRYPHIALNRVRTDSTKALQRVLSEQRARNYQTDLITSYTGLELREAKALQAFKSPVLDAYPTKAKDPGGMSAALYIQYFGMAAYNTDKVPEAQAPKSYDDLLNPKWKGQMVWGNDGTSGAPFLITSLRKQWGEEKTYAYLEKLAQQKIVTRSESGRTVIGMTISGEYPIMLLPFLTHIGEAVKKKAPVGGAMVDPVPGTATPIMLAKNAPHPHASMLVIDYLLDKEAQGVLRDLRYFPAHPDVAAAEEMRPFQPSARGLGTLLIDDAEASQMLQKTSEIFTKLFE
jgi:ABC-type Fe3+ transport system substrate-binding protein